MKKRIVRMKRKNGEDGNNGRNRKDKKEEEGKTKRMEEIGRRKYERMMRKEKKKI